MNSDLKLWLLNLSAIFSDSLQEECPGIHTTCVDLSNWSDAQTATEAIGDLDLLVNNAGVYSYETLLSATEEEYKKVYDINVASVLAVSQVAARKMVKQKKGRFGLVDIQHILMPKVCKMISWWMKNSLHSINIWDIVINAVPLCSVHQAPSYEPKLTSLAWLLPEFPYLSMIFILEVVCTACLQMRKLYGKWG